MAKKRSTIENRVYLFKDLAAAFLAANGASLMSSDGVVRARALRALGDIAHASCVVADTQKLDAEAVGKLVARGLAESYGATPAAEVGEAPRAETKKERKPRRRPKARRTAA